MGAAAEQPTPISSATSLSGPITVSVSSLPTSTLAHSPAEPTASGVDSTRFPLGPLPTGTSSTTTPASTGDAPFLLPNNPSASSVPQGSSGSSAPNSSNTGHNNGFAIKYYFIFLAFFIFFLVVTVWMLHRRKKRQKALLRESGVNALARDLESAGWSGNARRWVQGVAPWRIGADGRMAYSREEGLNELGEAPPPYKVPETGLQRTLSGREAPSTGHVEAVEEPAVPLRILSRDERDRIKPPGYEESVRGSTVQPIGSRPGSAAPNPAGPSLAAMHAADDLEDW